MNEPHLGIRTFCSVCFRSFVCYGGLPICNDPTCDMISQDMLRDDSEEDMGEDDELIF
jgi:hypothetical protein